MNTFAQRRFVNVTLAVLVAGLLVLFNTLYEMSLRDAAFLNGWLLFAGMVFLALFNARKKLPFQPLMAASTWLQIHVYLGLICALLFLLHSDFRLPNGLFEILLWATTVALFVTGTLGLVISRRLPLRLRSSGGERMLFERIPSFRAQLANEAEALAYNSLDETGNTAVANFYWTVLAPYLRKPRNLLAHLAGSRKHARRLENQIRELQRYENTKGRALLTKLGEITAAKDNLDHQYALQLTMKLWLFFHLPLSYSVLVLSVVHVGLAYAFGSAAP